MCCLYLERLRQGESIFFKSVLNLKKYVYWKTKTRKKFFSIKKKKLAIVSTLEKWNFEWIPLFSDIITPVKIILFNETKHFDI